MDRMMDIQEERSISRLLLQWRYDLIEPFAFMMRAAELIEEEMENVMKTDPDPFDDRHLCKTNWNRGLGRKIRLLITRHEFMDYLLLDYAREDYWPTVNTNGRDVQELNIAACRIMVDIFSCLDTSIIFPLPANDMLIPQWYTWAEEAGDPLQSYAIALLAAASEQKDLPVIWRENNNRLIPILLDRLHLLQTEVLMSRLESIPSDEETSATSDMDSEDASQVPTTKLPPDHPYNISAFRRLEDIANQNDSEGSNAWDEMESYTARTATLYPPTKSMKEMFILKYLTTMVEYEEFRTHLVEKNALSLILHIIDPVMWQNSHLTFQALRYLAAILRHKELAVEFVNMRGFRKLLQILRPGISSTAVSVCLYRLAQWKDTMEHICSLPSYIIKTLIKYELWLLASSHDSGKRHAAMFFELSFKFPVILREFEAENGLRKMYNVCNGLSILSPDAVAVADRVESSERQTVRHICKALEQYLEVHLHEKAECIRKSSCNSDRPNNDKNEAIAVSRYRTNKRRSDVMKQEIEFLQESMYFESQWQPVCEFIELGGITLLLNIINLAYGCRYVGRSESLNCALAAINICAVMPQAQTELCKRVEVPMDLTTADGLTLILNITQDAIHYNPDVRISALNVIITCVCAPMAGESRLENTWMSLGMNLMERPIPNKAREEALEKAWQAVRTSNGIMILMLSLETRVPIRKADEIRALATKSLVGFARSEPVRLILGKLSLFTTEKLQVLMENPINKDYDMEYHMLFKKHAIELFKKVFGTTTIENLFEPSIDMRKASILASTKIHFSSQQLSQLIHQHLLQHGMEATADTLQKETNLSTVESVSTDRSLSPFPCSVRSRYGMNNSMSLSSSAPLIEATSPPITKKSRSTTNVNNYCGATKNPSLQQNLHLDPAQSTSNTECSVTLESVITEYCANQHSLCKNPTFCPTFDLLRPHKCPDPKPRKMLYGNLATRISRGIHIPKFDRHFVYSRYLLTKSYTFNQEEGYFTTVAFLNDGVMVIGTNKGELIILNILKKLEVSSYPRHESYISNISVSPNGRMFASSASRRPMSSLWLIQEWNKLQQVDQLPEQVIEFNHANDKLIGTNGSKATIYNISTGAELLMSLSPDQSNHYTRNRATFDITDKLVLSDGVLWDVATAKNIHKFDKLNPTFSGVFHPNGLEIIANTEVWDIRMYRLLRTVPSLDQCVVTFPHHADIMFANKVDHEEGDTSFTVLDAKCYSDIKTVDVGNSIFQIAVNSNDTEIAIVENNFRLENMHESTIRLYDVGRQKSEGDTAVVRMGIIDGEPAYNIPD